MPLDRASRRSLFDAARLGAWLGVLALLLQLAVPLAQPAPAWADEGLFPPTCSVHHEDGSGGAADDALQCGQCVLCQSQAVGPLGLAPSRPVVAMVDGAAAVSLPPGIVDRPARPAVRPPLPSRGPPGAA